MPEIATAFVKSDAILTATADADIVDGETVVVGGKTYTFKASLTDTDGFLKHVTGFAANMLVLQKAIGLTGVAGTDYAASTTRNPYVDATLTSSGVVTFTARNAGAIGNLILITIGTSAVTLSGETSGALDGGTGFLDTLINDIQAESQINSDMIAVLALLETGTKFA